MSTVLIACDKFKGSLGAAEVCTSIGRGVRAANPEATVIALPVADGGDGTVEAALGADYEERTVRVTGPTGERLSAAFAMAPGTRTAVVEMAQASGLQRLPGGVRDPLGASSAGTGELVRAALDAGARRIVLGVGGSACTDGGAGFLAALGASLHDRGGGPLGAGGGALRELGSIDLTSLDPRLAEVDLVLASDVGNPLLGPDGAARVYGPQKGATGAQVLRLEEGLARWARLLTDEAGVPLRAAEQPGAGAAGGLGFAALAVLGATMRPGVEVVMDLTGFREVLARLTGSDLVITGEGSLDAQTLNGKAVAGVARAARARGVPVVAVCGRASIGGGQIESLGIRRAYPLTGVEPDAETCMSQAPALLTALGRRVATEWVCA